MIFAPDTGISIPACNMDISGLHQKLERHDHVAMIVK
jgi:hypothetical protein